MASSTHEADLLELLRELPPERGGVLQGERLVVALSGGADSLALLDLLLRLQKEKELQLLAAHLDHGLRESSERDGEFCHEFCAARGVEFVLERIDPHAHARKTGIGLEAAGRQLRYEFLDRLREARGFDRVCTGHHRDDHLETLLLWLFRGTGLAGMEGIRARGVDRLRPLREFSRARIREYLKWRELKWREDESNASAGFRRNRVRHELIPLLDDIFDAGAVERLGDFAEHGAALAAWLAERAEGERSALQRMPEPPLDPAACELLDRPGFCALQEPVQLEILRHIARELEPAGPQHWSRENLLRLLEFALKASPGHRFPLARGGWLVIDRDALRFQAPAALAEADHDSMRLCVELLPAEGVEITMTARNCTQIDADKIHGNLNLRCFRPGDRMRVEGMPGRKKVAELYREHGVPADHRDSMWIVEDEEGIVWTVGVATSQHCRITSATRRVLRLTLQPQKKESDLDDRT
ncbi:MAG TPA: tRNA lysidine(34) synthetase TilS [Candidatus Krumholzibacteria bacterium]|nr:tRNA lysidine(34) synthetase TilS [Candidatus Krumholzibacteria bacterium]